jgi:hypothetical protein
MRIAVGMAGRSYTMNTRIGVLRHRRLAAADSTGRCNTLITA